MVHHSLLAVDVQRVQRVEEAKPCAPEEGVRKSLDEARKWPEKVCKRLGKVCKPADAR